MVHAAHGCTLLLVNRLGSIYPKQGQKQRPTQQQHTTYAPLHRPHQPTACQRPARTPACLCHTGPSPAAAAAGCCWGWLVVALTRRVRVGLQVLLLRPRLDQAQPAPCVCLRQAYRSTKVCVVWSRRQHKICVCVKQSCSMHMHRHSDWAPSDAGTLLHQRENANCSSP